MQVGVEIGGTFTDLVWRRADGTVTTGKVASRPEAIHQAVLDAISTTGIDLKDIQEFAHGSTVATNTLLTRRGAITGLLVTEGFRDVVEIGTHDRVGNIYTAFYTKPRVPVARRHVREIAERVGADGTVIKDIDLEAAWRQISDLLSDGVTSIAICLLHAYRNPMHEKALLELVKERAPDIDVFASHIVSPEFREYERSVTTTVNAFVGPVVRKYVQNLEHGLAQHGYPGAMRLMQSSGGVMPSSAAGSNAVRMLLSGPSAGVRAAQWFAGRNQINDIITLDMGGTSTDVAIAPNLTPRVVSELTVDHLPIRSTAIDMATVGAGGGSIAAIDPGGFLNVGPASAGAYPGPASYGRGGDLPTVTDAQVVSGLLRPARFFGGNLPLRKDLAIKALESLNLPDGTGATADAILRMVNSNMAAAVRLVSTARGIDPRDFTLVAFGGGGPLHGAKVAEELGMTRVLIPWSPGIASAFGLLVADLILDVVHARVEPLTDQSFNSDAILTLQRHCDEQAASLGLEQGSFQVQYGADMRYTGQGYELPVWMTGVAHDAASLRQAFEDKHRTLYGYARPNLPVQLVNLRARIVRQNSASLITRGSAHTSDDQPVREVMMHEGRAVQTTFMSRASLAEGQKIQGPAVLEEPTSTVFIPEGWTCECLVTGDLILEKYS